MPTTQTAQEAFQDAIDQMNEVVSDIDGVVADNHIQKMKRAIRAMMMVKQYGIEAAPEEENDTRGKRWSVDIEAW